MSKHTLSLADLNAASPGVLSVVFGPDGQHIDAPLWRPPLRGRPVLDGIHIVSSGHVLSYVLDGATAWASVGPSEWAMIRDAALDLRIPTIAARFLALLRRLNVQSRSTRAAIRASTNRHLSGTWTESDAADLGVVVLALAPQIAALP